MRRFFPLDLARRKIGNPQYMEALTCGIRRIFEHLQRNPAAHDHDGCITPEGVYRSPPEEPQLATTVVRRQPEDDETSFGM